MTAQQAKCSKPLLPQRHVVPPCGICQGCQGTSPLLLDLIIRKEFWNTSDCWRELAKCVAMAPECHIDFLCWPGTAWSSTRSQVTSVHLMQLMARATQASLLSGCRQECFHDTRVARVGLVGVLWPYAQPCWGNGMVIWVA
jgi:hypothetical protein